MHTATFTTEREDELRAAGFKPGHPGEWKAPDRYRFAPFVEAFGPKPDMIALHAAGEVIICRDVDHVLEVLDDMKARGDA